MSTVYGINPKIVTSDMIYAVNLYNCTIQSGETGDFYTNSVSSYQLKVSHDTYGCSGPDSGIFLELKDTIPWTKITFEWLGLGTAACWSFSNSSSFGTGTGTPTGNLIDYNEAAGDFVFNGHLTWEVPAYQTHNKVYACDGDADNFFRFNAGVYKSFFMNRRRNVNGSRAGIHHGRSCSDTGVYTILRNIRIW